MKPQQGVYIYKIPPNIFFSKKKYIYIYILIIIVILLFSIDFSMDEKIQQMIRTEFLDCTILCIAHRLRTVIDYDKILVIGKKSHINKLIYLSFFLNLI